MATKLGLIILWVILLVWDVLCSHFGNPTESQTLRDWALSMTALPFASGFLLGHWYFPQNNRWLSGWMLAAPILLLLVGWDIFWNIKYPGALVWYRYPGIYALAGIPAGVFLWSQSY